MWPPCDFAARLLGWGLAIVLSLSGGWTTRAASVSTPAGTSYQVNVDAAGLNIPGDAANEPSLCVDPTDPRRLAIGWRQFNTTNSNFRQAGWGYSTDGGVHWTFGGTLETNVFRSDPVLAADADGHFYYLSLLQSPFRCDLWRSTNGGASWKSLGPAGGGDKAWMTIDTTTGPGRGHIYQAWDYASDTPDLYFNWSRDGGQTWSEAVAIPQLPYWGTLDVGPEGDLYHSGWDGARFWVNRSSSAPLGAEPFTFDLTTPVDLGGSLLYFLGYGPNPGGLLGQVWIAADRSTNRTRGNLYALCSTGTATNLCDVMFSRSTDRGATWSAPVRLNTDAGSAQSWHWFGTLSVAPNGRIDVCWNDTRHDPQNRLSELYYCSSLDGGLSWTTNRAISPPFDSLLGWPAQNKIGDYIGMVSLDDSACIAYSATFNGEQDIYFVRVEQPILLTIAQTDRGVQLSWNAVVGRTYCLQSTDRLADPWPIESDPICLVATNRVMTITDAVVPGPSQRFYRLVEGTP